MGVKTRKKKKNRHERVEKRHVVVVGGGGDGVQSGLGRRVVQREGGGGGKRRRIEGEVLWVLGGVRQGCESKRVEEQERHSQLERALQTHVRTGPRL